MVTIDKIPGELKRLPQWVLWRTLERDGKPTKIPYGLDGNEAKSNDPATWAAFPSILHQLGGYDGPGFVLSAGFVGVDLDGCRDPETGAVADWAREVIERFDSYSEVSPSGSGVKIFCRGEYPFPNGRGKNRKIDAPAMGGKAAGVEMYCRGRYFAVTGQRLSGVSSGVEERTEALAWLASKYFPERTNGKSVPVNFPEPVDGDANVLERARAYLAEVPPAISGQGGHNQTFRAACVLVLGFDLPEADAFCLLSEWNRGCQPPWSDGELLKKIRDAANEPGERGHLRDRPAPNGRGGIVDNVHGSSPNGPDIATAEGRTELANAVRFAAQHGQNVRWVDVWGKWLCWDGQRWRVDEACRIDALGKDTARAVWQEAADAARVQVGDKNAADAMFRFAKQTTMRSGVCNMLALAKSEPGMAITPDGLDSDPWKLNCANGVIDLKTGELQPHRREDFFTKVCPVEYDRDADCPIWLAFLRTIFADDQELIGFMRRAVGMSLTGSTSEHALFFCFGGGANGKSTFIETALALLGDDYATKAPSELLLAKKTGHPTELTTLWGRRLVACTETDDGRRLAESQVKELCGGDKLTARRMREDFWTFSPTHKLWLASNHKPRVKGTDHGIWRRIKLIPFNVRIPEADQDRDLGEKLRAELPGILLWAVAGCLEWQASGLREPEAVRAATREYREEENDVGQFVAECCELDDAAATAASELYAAYKRWANERPMNPTQFGRRLEEAGFTKNPNTRPITRIGLAIRPEWRSEK